MLPFLPLAPLLSSAGVSALNRLLMQESWAAQRLARHAGKTVRLAVGETYFSLTIASDGRVQRADTAIVPDVTLTLPASGLGQLFEMIRQKDAEQLVDAMHIQGDAGLASVVADLARHLRWDFEADLARLTGDIPAARLVSGSRSLVQGLQRASERLAGNFVEYVTEEEPLVLGRNGFAAQQGQLALLSTRLDQLEQRLTRLTRSARSTAGRS